MTTMTYTAPAATAPSLNIAAAIVKSLTPVVRFLSVFIGVTGPKSAYIGVNQNGNPIWAGRP